MKRLWSWGVIVGVCGWLGVAEAQETPTPADHVVLVSIDGLRPEFYLDPRYPTPTLRGWAEDGAHAAGVRSVFPSVTYPSHTSLITGARPARHGVYYNSVFNPEAETGAWYWNYDAIQTPTLFDALQDAERVTASVSWPVTVGAPVDFLLPEVWSLNPLEDPLNPLRDGSTPGLIDELEREAVGRIHAARFNPDMIGRDDLAADIAAYLLEHKQPSLLALHLIEVDHFEHAQGREGDDVHRALVSADRALRHLWEAARRAGIADRTAFVVVGDHGFVDIHTALCPNVWLLQAGLRGRSLSDPWRVTVHANAASAFVHLRDPDDHEALAAVRALLDDLPHDVRSRFEILEREQLDALGADPSCAFALHPNPGVVFSARTLGPAVRPAHGGTHGYLPDLPQLHTGFVAWGAGVQPGARAPLLEITDVAPYVARLLGVPFDAPDGAAPLGFLQSP